MGTRKMSDVVKYVKTGSPERYAVENAIDTGKFRFSKQTKLYLQRPPYQYTSLEPKSWGKHKEREDSHE